MHPMQRIEKENAQAEKFWTKEALKNTTAMLSHTSPAAASVAPSAVPSNYTSKTSYLKDRLERLEQELQLERGQRKKVGLHSPRRQTMRAA